MKHSISHIVLGTQLGAMALAGSIGLLIGSMVAENNGELIPYAGYYFSLIG